MTKTPEEGDSAADLPASSQDTASTTASPQQDKDIPRPASRDSSSSSSSPSSSSSTSSAEASPQVDPKANPKADSQADLKAENQHQEQQEQHERSVEPAENASLPAYIPVEEEEGSPNKAEAQTADTGSSDQNPTEEKASTKSGPEEDRILDPENSPHNPAENGEEGTTTETTKEKQEGCDDSPLKEEEEGGNGEGGTSKKETEETEKVDRTENTQEVKAIEENSGTDNVGESGSEGSDLAQDRDQEKSGNQLKEVGEEEDVKGVISEKSGSDVINMSGKGDSNEVNSRTETEVRKNGEATSGDSIMENKETNGPAAELRPGEKGQAETGTGCDAQDTTPAHNDPQPPADNGKGGSDAPRPNPNATTAADNYEDDFCADVPVEDDDEPRGDAGRVVPVPVVGKKKKRNTSDGRSVAEGRGELRGEDRSEQVNEEESDDSRGKGQWKTEEEVVLQSSLANQRAEKEALQTVIDEKVKIQKDLNDLKGRYLTLEESSRRWEGESGALKQACQDQNLRIQGLEAELHKLRDFEQWGQDNETKVRDLQDRLASLAGEDADKERRIQRLQEELQDTRSRLVVAERQVAVNEAAADQLVRAPPKSKTCTIL